MEGVVRQPVLQTGVFVTVCSASLTKTLRHNCGRHRVHIYLKQIGDNHVNQECLLFPMPDASAIMICRAVLDWNHES